MIKEFNSIDEIQKYYDKKTNTYNFKEDGEYIDLVIFYFDLNIPSNIKAFDINAQDIRACDINACNINAWDIIGGDIIAFNIKAGCIIANDISAWDIKNTNINARNVFARNITTSDIKADYISSRDINANNIKCFDIDYYAVCFAYESIKCKSIKGHRENAKHFVLDGEVEIEED